MVCPYKVDVVIEYATIDKTLVKNAERTEFAPCDETECPFYDVLGACMRADKEIEQ